MNTSNWLRCAIILQWRHLLQISTFFDRQNVGLEQGYTFVSPTFSVWCGWAGEEVTI